MTNRQFTAYEAWDREQMNNPGKIEYYLMLIAYYVACSNAKNPKSLSLDKMRLRFKASADGSSQEPVNPEQVRYQKAVALARLGGARIRLPDGKEVTKEEILGLPPKSSQRSNVIDEMIAEDERLAPSNEPR